MLERAIRRMYRLRLRFRLDDNIELNWRSRLTSVYMVMTGINDELPQKALRGSRALTTVDKRYATDRHRPCEEEDKSLRYKGIRIDGANILIYVVPILRYNVLCIEYVLTTD